MPRDIRSMKWVVLSRPNCSWCDRAKELLRSYQVSFTEFDINQATQLKDFVLANGLTTVPQVYVDGTHVGGFENLEATLHLNTGWP